MANEFKISFYIGKYPSGGNVHKLSQTLFVHTLSPIYTHKSAKTVNEHIHITKDLIYG